MSEPQAGSDLASVATRAVPIEGGWQLHGHKIWTSLAHKATHMYVLARSNADVEKHAGLTEFIIDMDWPGIQVTPILDMSGAHHFNEVHLDGVKVPHERVLGEIDNGWNQVIEQLSFERGGAERFLSTYQLFAHLVLVHRDSMEMKGRLVAQLAALRTLCWEVARLMDEGVAPVVPAAALKIMGNEFERMVVEECRPALLSQDFEAAGAYASALLACPSFSIRGGASDVLLSIIAKEARHE